MPLEEYAVLLRNNLQRIIGDVERLIYTLNGNRPREEWEPEVTRQYSLIRRQLLDTAGDIGRLPEDVHVHKPTVEEEKQAFWNKVFR